MRPGRRYVVFGICLLAVATVPVMVSSCGVFRGEPAVPSEYTDKDKPPSIDPDYSGCVVPSNIAPLNFAVEEEGTDYRVRIYSGAAPGFVVASSSGKIEIPLDKWRDLLGRSRGGELCFDVYVCDKKGTWRRYQTVTNKIAAEDIDGYVVYRLLGPIFQLWMEMGIYQRSLADFREDVVVATKGAKSGACINCHSFVSNRPDNFAFHMRYPPESAMLLVRKGRATKVDTRTQYNPSSAAYISWHPNGELIAFSANKISQIIHTTGDARDVLDTASDLAVYDVASGKVFSTADISKLDRLETFPSWSPDGRYLYFCSAPAWWPTDSKPGTHFKGYREVQYDLMRIGYDAKTGEWGKLEVVLRSKDVEGKSLVEPRVSPDQDGRFLLFCATDYGSFPVFRRSSDLYIMDLMDLRAKKYWPLDSNSRDEADSWHCWSSNGRWIAFASKRRTGEFSRIYLSYIDHDGNAHKPVLLPQADPTFYDSYMKNYNVPELVTGPVKASQRGILGAIYGPQKGRTASAVSGATPKAGARPKTPPASRPASAPAPAGER